jgi:antitoxin component of MazEF toxin-antitoxin module
MKTSELTVTRVGNSRGVRLPAEVLRRYQIGDTLIMGLTLQQTADLLGISRRTADRIWAFAQAWLFQEMRGPTGAGI